MTKDFNPSGVLMSPRKAAIQAALQDARASRTDVEACAKEWTLAHDTYNQMVTQQPKKGRYSGTTLENYRMHAMASYERLLDVLRIHSDNLAHLAVLGGRL